ncbi:uncharacterized protein LOC120591119 [Pteropus medius]|uniref:uncharacterized protein LOC120591119 n=1 Tax=Pteropus vampyrus TaxID=132908 RepID=UPI00196AD674|nr:uncharacterized protein LOC120591119 [Pteropus giganteus]
MQWVLIARSPAAVQSQYSQFTGHCSPRARRPPGVIPAAGGGSRAPVPALSEGAGTAPAGGQWSREAVGSEPAASPACQPCSSLLLLLELNPIHVSATHSRPSFCSGCPDKRESLPARGARVSNKPVSTLTPLRQRGSQSTDRKEKSPSGRFGHRAAETTRVTERSESGFPPRAKKQLEPSSGAPKESVPSHPRELAFLFFS